MSKPKFELKHDIIAESPKETVSVSSPVLGRYMIGTYFNAATGDWHITTLRFDPATGTMGEYKDKREGPDWHALRERITIMINQLNLFEKENLPQENK